MAISTAVSRFADYHRRKGCGATIRRAGTGTIETTNFCSALATAASPDATTSRWESRGRLILWPNELSVKVLREVSELEEIRREWESWPGNRDSDIHSYLTFLRSNPGTSRPHVLVVYRGGSPDAILVGRVDRERLACRMGYLRVSPPARIMNFVNGALRGNPASENCDLMVNEILRSLSQGEADVAYMNFLRPESDLYRLATTKPGLLSRDYVRITQPHFGATLPATVEEMYRSLPAGLKGFNKTKHNKLLREYAGRIEIKCFREVAEIDVLAQDVEQVASTSYQRGLGVGFKDNPATRERLRLKAEKGWLRAYVLYLADRPCAFWIGDINQGTFGGDYIGYDPEFGKYSPGMFLLTKVLEGFCDANGEGVTGVDFGPGNAQYKELLSNQRWLETSVYIFAPALKGVSLNLLRTLVGRMDQTVKKVLARTGLLQKTKKSWRAYLTKELGLGSARQKV